MCKARRDFEAVFSKMFPAHVVSPINTIFEENTNRYSTCKAQGLIDAILNFQFLTTLSEVKHYMFFMIHIIATNECQACSSNIRIWDWLDFWMQNDTAFWYSFRYLNKSSTFTTAEFYYRNFHHPYFERRIIFIQDLVKCPGSCYNRMLN